MYAFFVVAYFVPRLWLLAAKFCMQQFIAVVKGECCHTFALSLHKFLYYLLAIVA